MIGIESEKQLARARVDLFRARFRGVDDSFFPIKIALMWDEAVHAEPLEPQKLKDILAMAWPRRKDFEIAYFGFCNDMYLFCQRLEGQEPRPE